MEQILILIKPDGIQRGYVGEVIRRFEQKGLKLVGIKMMTLESAILREHYAHIASKPFYPGVEQFMKSSPVVAMVWEGVDVVATVRRLCGVTNSREAEPGSIRGDLAMSVACNIVHASDSTETAKAEVKRFFKRSELFHYEKATDQHLYMEDERKGAR